MRSHDPDERLFCKHCRADVTNRSGVCPMTPLTKDELQLDSVYYQVVNKWLARGDGIACYENVEFGSPDMGHRKCVSFGSKSAQIETDIPPVRMPDIGSDINWRYHLVGVYKGEALI